MTDILWIDKTKKHRHGPVTARLFNEVYLQGTFNNSVHGLTVSATASTQWLFQIYTSLSLNHIAMAILIRLAPAKAGQAISKIKIAHSQTHSGIIRGSLQKIKKIEISPKENFLIL